MFGVISRRFFHSGKACLASTSNSTSLGKLRKATGYSISNCKKALEMFPDNVQKAEEWLHEEAKKLGWSKWNKIQNRSAVQGLIGIYTEDTLGIMVEVNCETDFVAKNVEFQQLVGNVLLSCIEREDQSRPKHIEEVDKYLLDESELLRLKHHSSTLQELVNTAMCKFNEKTVLKRAVIMRTPLHAGFGIAGLSHPSETSLHLPRATIGKFGALVAYRQNEATIDDIKAMGLNMCQHIIGMNPLSIGAEDFLNLYRSGKINIDTDDGYREEYHEEEIKESDTEPEETVQTDLKDTDETRLLFQSYLLDPTRHVYDYTFKQAEILDFERFECGGESKTSSDIQHSAEAQM